MNKRQLIICSAIICALVILSRCISKQPAGGDMRGPQYAAANSCESCHKAIYDSYQSTAHAHTSGLANAQTVKGTLTAPANRFVFGNGTEVVMEQQDGRLYQAAYSNGALQQKQAFDIAVGSGRKAQTFLYWQAGKYMQLPISWFVPANSWANSPGFPADHPKFDRAIPSTCFGCHSSMVGIKSVSAQGLEMQEEFEQNKLVAGIDCQRCHGPAADHVNYQTEHPQEKTAHFMAKIGALNTQQQIDMCAVCHSGLKPMLKPASEFKPGDALADFVMPTAPFPTSRIDVHGNQLQLLAASKCFTGSKQMTCSSCHSPHKTERENMQVFSQRCMSCHMAGSPNFCTLKTVPAATLQQNCIDCHMPATPSSAITLLTNGKQSPTPDSIRTHWIKVYKEVK
ncbi:multiheme c-type cytochrome [uncultured Chitinophaga sp.]|uniref:multiheme c-type cytochrome n=1 Tax=uncultured Chitinophaga sp. TaxID=339340 RepID=UPI0025E337EB|nr:multiheme c-type cytochrome [uncultured Chitinophaga sp.]